MSRYFTLEEAQRLIPTVDEMLTTLLDAKKSYDAADEDLRKLNSRISMMGGSMIHPGDILTMRAKKEANALMLKEFAEKLQNYGILLKDLDIGLVDFPTLYRGVEVYLCWKRGETAIEFWHGVTEGFQGRKRIDEEFLANHRGGVQ